MIVRLTKPAFAAAILAWCICGTHAWAPPTLITGGAKVHGPLRRPDKACFGQVGASGSSRGRQLLAGGLRMGKVGGGAGWSRAAESGETSLRCGACIKHPTQLGRDLLSLGKGQRAADHTFPRAFSQRCDEFLPANTRPPHCHKSTRSIGGAPSLLAPFIRTRADRLLRLPAQPLSAYSPPGLRR